VLIEVDLECSDGLEGTPRPERTASPDVCSAICELEEIENSLTEVEPEVELENDPFQLDGMDEPGPEWEAAIKAVIPRKAETPSAGEQRTKIREILRILETERKEPTAEQVAESEGWLRNIQALIPDHEKFVASSFSHFYPAWHELLKDTGRKSAKRVVSWIKNGFRPKFVGTAAAKPEKRKVVLQMLRKIVPAERIDEYLLRKYPHPIQFKNHRSLYKKWGFSSGQIFKLVEADATGIWQGPEPPIIIHPMGVVDSAGKDRMIVNGRYLNLFLEALPFRNERLRDVLAFTFEHSHIATWDLKSGYFYVPIHKDYWKFFCFKVGSVIFYFKVLCFGFAQACYVFTKVMQEPAMELRKRGMPLSDYIDDSFTAARTWGRCIRQSSLSALFFGALGAFFGIPKCNLWPEQVQPWLGFIVDSEQQAFRVSEAKIAKLKRALTEMLERPSTSPRKLAALAGKILSVSPAVLPAALFGRSFYAALRGKVSWDDIFPTPLAVQETTSFWLKHIDQYNGRSWWPKPVEVQAAVDASGVGFGGTI
jgi:hypothetical protein